MLGQVPGNSRFTAGGELGRSGKPKRVFFISVASQASTAGTLALYNGTSASGDKYVGDIGATAGSGGLYDLGGHGIRFENGCYVACSANSGVSYALIVYQEEQ